MKKPFDDLSSGLREEFGVEVINVILEYARQHHDGHLPRELSEVTSASEALEIFDQYYPRMVDFIVSYAKENMLDKINARHAAAMAALKPRFRVLWK